MFGISGTALGAILRSKKHSYGDISIVAFVYAIVVFFIAFGALLLGTGITVFASWLPETMTLIWASLVIGFSAFIAMFVGAAVFDVAEAIIRSR